MVPQSKKLILVFTIPRVIQCNPTENNIVPAATADAAEKPPAIAGLATLGFVELVSDSSGSNSDTTTVNPVSGLSRDAA